MNRDKLAFDLLKTYIPDIPSSWENDIIACPFNGDDIFPVGVADDGGIDFFSFELPITQQGDLIKVGGIYETEHDDAVEVVRMELNYGLAYSRWFIYIPGDDEPYLCHEFISIVF